MNFASLLFLLLTGTALQAMLPVFMWTGYATFPVLASVVVYFALYRSGGFMLTVALLAGLFQDSLSLIPIGYSSFCFAACGVVIQKYRDMMMIQSTLTHMVLMAAMHGLVTLVLAILMLNEGMIPWQPGWLLLKIPGAMLMGIITGPLVIAAAQALEEKLGLIEGNSEQYGAQRTFYGIG